jgi:site-specific DNA-methyltransferase (adenine-specific)
VDQLVTPDREVRVDAHRLILGDCLDVLPALPAESVDVVVTSPPYNLGVAYRQYRDNRAEQDYLDWLLRVAAEVRRVMRPEGSFFLNIAGSSKAPWLPFELIVRLRELFVLQNHITWIKSIAIGRNSVGHYKPVGGKRFLHHNHEHIFHLTLTGAVKLDRLAIGVPFKDKSNIARRGHARDLRCRGNTWHIPYGTVQSKAAKFGII